MSEHIQGIIRNQLQILDLESIIGEANEVRVIDAFVEVLDLVELGFKKAISAETGRPPYHPGDLLKLYLYGYRNHIRTSRRLEAECHRNLEVMWLLKGVRPGYKTISNFRKDHPRSFRQVFRLFARFLRDEELVEGKTVGIDSMKTRAQNSKKNNYSRKKIDRHLDYIESQIENYVQALEENDKKEDQLAEECKEKKKELLDKISAQILRRKKYRDLSNQLDAGEEKQISSTDPDSRALPVGKNIVEVSYSEQVAVDGKNKLIVHYQTTNEIDTNALGGLAVETKKELEVDQLDALADKGYHTGAELKKCAENGITTYVAPLTSSQNGKKDPAYQKDKFDYKPEPDVYICPHGEILTTNGEWYEKKGRDGKVKYRYKHYVASLEKCLACPALGKCTNAKNSRGRYIQRTENDDFVEANRQRVEANRDYYCLRQTIVEHPFGTIKRGWGYTYTLLRGKEKVDGEFGLIFTCYNLRRSVSIFGVKRLIQAINEWGRTRFSSFWQQGLSGRLLPVLVFQFRRFYHGRLWSFTPVFKVG